MNDENNKVIMVEFEVCGSELEAGKDGETVWVSVRRVCEALKLTKQGQLMKLREKAWAALTTIAAITGDGEARTLLCIPLKVLPMWLATIKAGKVAVEVRPTLERLQKEAADILAEHFVGERIQTPASGRTTPEAARRARLVLSVAQRSSPAATRQQDELLRASTNGLDAKEREAASEVPGPYALRDSLDDALPGDDVPGPVPSEQEREIRDLIHDRWEADAPDGNAIEPKTEALPEASPKIAELSCRALVARFEQAGMTGVKADEVRDAATKLGLLGDPSYGRWGHIENEYRQVLSYYWRYYEQALQPLEQTLHLYRENIAKGMGKQQAMDAAVAKVGKIGSGTKVETRRPLLKIIRAPQ